ncbi:MAG: hypothetical protein ACI9U2_004147 [Bradymonadia bacterium]|jgi:hypothetical protein
MRVFAVLLLVSLGCDDGSSADAVDASAPDAATVDARVMDARIADARIVDAAVDPPLIDALTPDAQLLDAGLDAGPLPLPHALRPRPAAAGDVPAPRDWRWARGLIHMHSVHSHDACDGEPKPDGVANPVCVERFRAAACHNRFDYLLLTDHPDSFAEIPFEDAFFHMPGDRWIEGDDGPIANMLMCPDGHAVMLAVGSEGDLMPVMFTRKPPTAALRDASPAGVATLREAGALVFQAHTERFTAAVLAPLGLDGIEIYNLHANLAPDGELRQLPELLPDLLAWINAGPGGPHPDLAFLTVFRENHLALAAFDGLIATTRILGFAGSDIHENLPPIVRPSDGDRMDSYRRLGSFFSNYLLIPAADTTVTPDAIRGALTAGRGLVVFDLWGPPSGFDFHARDAEGALFEMGSEAAFTPGMRITVELPNAPSAQLRMVLKRVTVEGTAVLVEASDAIDVEVPGPGAYRVEVHMTPEQIRPELGALADRFMREVVWIYSNPLYLR